MLITQRLKSSLRNAIIISMIQKCVNSKTHKFQAAYRTVETESTNDFGTTKTSVTDVVLFCERCSQTKDAEILMLTQ